MPTLRKLTDGEAERENRRASKENLSKHHGSGATYQVHKPRDDKSVSTIGGLSVTEMMAYRFRLQGYSFSQIAEQCGYASAAGASEAYKRAREKIDDLLSDTKEQRELAISRMDRLLQAVWDRADNGYLPAIDRALKIEERRAKILGIDAPEKMVNVNHDVSRLNIERIFADESAIDLIHATMGHLSALSSGNGVVSDGGTVQNGETSDLSDEDPDVSSNWQETSHHRDDAT